MDFDLVDLMPCNLRSDLIDGDLIAEMGLYVYSTRNFESKKRILWVLAGAFDPVAMPVFLASSPTCTLYC